MGPRLAARKLASVTQVGSGSINEKQEAPPAEIITRATRCSREALPTETSSASGKPETEKLVEQVASNTKAQFATSPMTELLDAIIATYAAHLTMSEQVPDSVPSGRA